MSATEVMASSVVSRAMTDDSDWESPMVVTVWIVGFLTFTFSVAFGTWFIVGRMEKSTDAAEEFYSGGRALTWFYIFGSLMLTNLSTETLVGLNGDCWKDGNMAAMAWESTAALALILTTVVFLPRFYRAGFVTTPALLESVFGLPIRTVVSVLFMLMYTIILLPANLYSCGVAFHTMFGLEELVDLYVIIIFITIIGCIYALGGGMKSVAVSDTLNGLGLLVGGIAVPCVSLYNWGGILWEHKERMAVLVPSVNTQHPLLKDISVSMPATAVFSGTLLIQVFYWSTNQVIVQRALCAKTFAHGQKGLLLAAVFKMLGPFMLCLVGVLALGVNPVDLDIDPEGNQKEILSRIDRVYPGMVKLTMPTWCLGVFAGVLLGSALSSFNSGLASASTLFVYEVYPFFKGEASDTEKVSSGRIVGLVIAVVSSGLGANIGQMPDGVFTLVRKYKHVFGLPILVLFLLAIVSFRPCKPGGWTAIATGMASYQAMVVFPQWQPEWLASLHWIHKYLFCVVFSYLSHEVVAYASGAELRGAEKPAERECVPWKFTNQASFAIVAVLVTMYVALTFPNALLIGVLIVSWVVVAVCFFVDGSTDNVEVEPPLVQTEISTTAS